MENVLSEIFDLGSIKIDLEGKTKEAVFLELIEAIAVVCPKSDRAMMFKAIEEREKKMSTGIKEGVAIPHAFCEGIGRIAGAIGISKQGIEYGALDNRPVHVIFLLVSQQADENHLHVLNSIFKLVKSEALSLIKNAKNAEEIHALLSGVH